MLLTALFAFASSAWTPTCESRTDTSVWFVLTGATGTTSVTKDFNCDGLFFDGTPCSQTVAVGKIKYKETNNLGRAVHELRYLPYGDITGIVTFLNQPGGGVAYVPPSTAGLSPAATPAPPTSAELLRVYLEKRNKAFAATKGVTINLWTCPDAPFVVPDDVISPVGMIVRKLSPKVPMNP